VVAPSAAIGRATGKVILLGEHAVVYGSPAIALGLERGAEAEARFAPRSRLILSGTPQSNDAAPDDGVESDAGRAFRALLDTLGVGSVEAEARLEIPAGAGLGASAALGVALARAVLGSTQNGDTTSVARAALAWENVFHGNASGLDTAVAEHSGCIFFTRAAGVARLTVAAPLCVAVAVVEPGASTRRMVEGVAARRKADAQGVDRCMAAIAELVRQARESIEAGRISSLGLLMNDNHVLLRELGVSTAGLDGACRQALEAGALGAKLTGAGGGGSVIALVEEGRLAAVHAEWASRGYACLQARAGVAP
jgi:mevalonate kinase